MSKGVKFRLELDHQLIKNTVTAACQKGVWSALDHLAAVSKEQVPLDHGPLKNSCYVGVSGDGTEGVVSYDTPYAVVQHENMKYHHQRGRKAKYLEDPVNDKGVQEEMKNLLARAFSEQMGGV